MSSAWHRQLHPQHALATPRRHLAESRTTDPRCHCVAPLGLGAEPGLVALRCRSGVHELEPVSPPASCSPLLVATSELRRKYIAASPRVRRQQQPELLSRARPESTAGGGPQHPQSRDRHPRTGPRTWDRPRAGPSYTPGHTRALEEQSHRGGAPWVSAKPCPTSGPPSGRRWKWGRHRRFTSLPKSPGEAAALTKRGAAAARTRERACTLRPKWLLSSSRCCY